ncbi:MAG: peptidoglycan D,D-transpeptidase FtsI family protein [Acidimicrobiales bacterium]
MNRQIARLGVGFLVMYTVLFVQLNRVQVFQADELQEDPGNTRSVVREFGQPRGSISTADGVLLAQSVPVEDEQFDRARVYPEGELYAHVTGHYSFNVGATGVERTYDGELAGTAFEQEFASLGDLFLDRDTTADLTLTLRDDVQRVAREALGERKGSVVAVDPRTGAVLAAYSWPTYDPNPVSGVDPAAANAAWDALVADPANPALERFHRELFFPGSTFKVVTAASALEAGAASLSDPSFPAVSSYTPPLTEVPITNFGGSTCGGPLLDMLRQSCNTAFAQLASEHVGPDPMIERAEAFGFNETPPIDLPGTEASFFPTDFGAPLQSVESFYGEPVPTTPEGEPVDDDELVFVHEDTPALARSAIGQLDVKSTPLQMALVGAAVANEGLIQTPHVVGEIRNRDAEVIGGGSPGLWRQAMAPSTAGQMREAMLTVVESGTATRLAVPGFEVGGKTGTAQLGRNVEETHAWIVGFAGPPGEEPTVAVAVIIEADPDIGQQTGGTVAAPVAQQVLAAALDPAPGA